MTLQSPELWRLDFYDLICYGNSDNEVFRRREGRGTFEKGRMWELTSDEAKEAFKENTAQLAQLPSLILAECYCRRASECARKAYLSRLRNIREEGTFISFEFRHLSGTFSSYEAFTCLTDISQDVYERNRTHWAVKEGNLVERVNEYWKEQADRDKPRVFGLDSWPLHEKEHIAVMMPFSTSFDPVFEAIKHACERSRVPFLRVDEIYGPNVIIKDIFTTIETSKLVICDITDKNPNVLYEAGIAHARNKDVILLTQNDGDVPFNLSQIRHIRYLPNQEGLKHLEDELQQFITAAMA